MARRFAFRHLEFSDLITEAAVAVYMLVIINGYVELSQLHTQFYYIVGLDIGASIGWGLIDGFTYAMSESIDRGNQASLVRRIQTESNSPHILDKIVKELDSTFLSSFTAEGKRNVALEILKNSSIAKLEKHNFVTKKDLAGLVSIIGIYLAAGIVLSISYIILPDKLTAWVVSNLIGIAWLFYYGYIIGKIARQKRILVGFLTSGTGIALLIISYLIFA